LKVVAHPDPFVLEQELLRRVRLLQESNPLARVLVLVPTIRLADHVRRRLARDREACLAVDVVHHRALLRRIVEPSPDCPLTLASTSILEAVLGQALATVPPENTWARFTGQRPGARRSLLATLRELREAALAPDEVRRHLDDSPEQRDLGDVYAAYVAALERHRPRGLADDATLVLEATPLVPAFAEGFRGILHHGAYELTGIHLRLLRALDRVVPVTYLMPAEAGAPAFRYANRFARDFLLAEGGKIQRLDAGDDGGSLLGARLGMLYSEEERPRPLASASVGFLHAQGAGPEVTSAVREALTRVSRGIEPEEIAFVARSLAPYALPFEEALEDASLPWSASTGTPLRRQPLVRDLLGLLAILRDDFPRAATARWLASPRIRWETLLPDEPPPPGDLAEAWSRQAGLLGGLAEWREDLPAWAETPQTRRGTSPDGRAAAEEIARTRGVQARGLATALSRLARRGSVDEARSWSGHADLVTSLLTELLVEPEAAREPVPALTEMLGLLEEMRHLETVLGETRPVSFAKMTAWLEAAAEAASLPSGEPDTTGFRVLDAMQARGQTFKCVFLVGMHAGLFPRAPREDPFLPDAARARLREACRTPLPVKMEGDDEERLILALLLGSATEEIRISWQRAGEDGRSRMPSLALREVGRIVLGEPDLEKVKERADALPSHPELLLKAMEAGPGLLAPGEDLLLTALQGDSVAAAAPALRKADPLLGPGLEMLEALESFSPERMEYDGRVGSAARQPAGLSVTGLEQLGRCPLRYFFGRVLGVRGLDEEALASGFAVHELGSRIHDLLEAIYTRLAEAGALRADAAACREQARTLLDELWPEMVVAASRRRAARLPVLWNLILETWRQSTLRFLDADLARLVAAGWRQIDLEIVQEESLMLDGARSLQVHGRFDRRLRGPEDAVCIGDYKTSGKLREQCNPTKILKLHRLQVPLYWLLGQREADVELLGVGPDFDPGAPREEDRRVTFRGFADPEQEQGFREGLAVLADLLHRGAFPLRPDNHCHWCDYRPACRRSHPPTMEREELAPDTRDYRDIQRRSSKRPLLAQVREEPS